jgi:hypothetical protein
VRLRRWESWIDFYLGTTKVGEILIRRHFTEEAAQAWADSIATSPLVLAASLDSIGDARAGGHMLRAEPVARRTQVAKIVPVAKRSDGPREEDLPPPSARPPRTNPPQRL